MDDKVEAKNSTKEDNMSTVSVQIVRPPQEYANMIQFIKDVRNLTGHMLKESKDFVDGVKPMDVLDSQLPELIKIIHKHQARLTSESEVMSSMETFDLLRTFRDLVADPNKDKSYLLGWLDAKLATKK